MRKPGEDRRPKEDLDVLLNGSIEMASDLLAQDGEFEPFALALRKNGEILHLAPEDHDEDLEPEAVVETLRSALRDQRAALLAIAIVADVTLEDDDGQRMAVAISVAMEHTSGDAVNCYVPYEIEGEEVQLADLLGEPGERFVFGSDAPN